jgi:hypothetical protein
MLFFLLSVLLGTLNAEREKRKALCRLVKLFLLYSLCGKLPVFFPDGRSVVAFTVG